VDTRSGRSRSLGPEPPHLIEDATLDSWRCYAASEALTKEATLPAERLSMRKTREILRLLWGERLSGRAVAKSVACSPTTVADCVGRAKVAGLSWPLSADLDDGAVPVNENETVG